MRRSTAKTNPAIRTLLRIKSTLTCILKSSGDTQQFHQLPPEPPPPKSPPPPKPPDPPPPLEPPPKPPLDQPLPDPRPLFKSELTNNHDHQLPPPIPRPPPRRPKISRTMITATIIKTIRQPPSSPDFPVSREVLRG